MLCCSGEITVAWAAQLVEGRGKFLRRRDRLGSGLRAGAWHRSRVQAAGGGVRNVPSPTSSHFCSRDFISPPTSALPSPQQAPGMGLADSLLNLVSWADLLEGLVLALLLLHLTKALLRVTVVIGFLLYMIVAECS